MKRVLSLILAVVLLCSCLPVTTFAQEYLIEESPADVTEPVAEETEPVVEETEPAAVESEPVAEEIAPVVEATEPAAEETEHTVEETVDREEIYVRNNAVNSTYTWIKDRNAVDGSNYTRNATLAQKLNSIFDGNASVYSNSSCTNLVNTRLGTSNVPNNGVTKYVGPNGGPAINSGTSCWIYANGVYYTLFGECTGSGTAGSNSVKLNLNSTSSKAATYNNFKTWGVRQGVGALIRAAGHSMIVLSYDENYLTILDGNGDSNGLVSIRVRSWDRVSFNVEYIIQPKDSYYNSKYPNTTNYTVSFNANGGTGAPSSITAAAGSTITIPSDLPTRFGYNFLYWRTVVGSQEYLLQPGMSFTVNGNVTFTANWGEAVDIKADCMDYASSIDYVGEAHWYRFVPSKQNQTMIFKSWDGTNTGANLDMVGELYDASGNLLASDDDSGEGFHFYLEYTFEGKQNEIFYLKVRMYGSQTGNYQIIAAPIPSLSASATSVNLNVSHNQQNQITFSCLGYLEREYYLNAQRSGSGFVTEWGDWDNRTIPLTITGTERGSGTITVTLRYSDTDEILDTLVINVYVNSEGYTISFDANGGNDAPGNMLVDEGTTFTLPSDVPERFGYTFRSWVVYFDGEYHYIKPGETFVAYQDLTFVAYWDEAWLVEDNTVGFGFEIEFPGQSYWVKVNPCWRYYQNMVFRTVGNKDTRVYLYDSDGNQLAWNDDTSEGYNCQLYYQFEGASDKIFYVKFNMFSNNTGETYAEVYRGNFLHFNANGGSGEPASYFYPHYQSSYTIPNTVPTRDGYVFLGWSFNPDATEAAYYSGFDIGNISDDVVLYAVWLDADCAAGKHNYFCIDAASATCTTEGWETYHCNNCSDELTVVIPRNDNHNEYSAVTQPTCTEKGYTTYTCIECGESRKTDYVNAKGHTGGTATCKEKAVCTCCNTVYGNLNPSNHVGGTETRDAKEATCMTAGYTGDIYCKGCSTKLSFGQNIAALGHDYVKTTIAPTYTEKGYDQYTCSHCGDHYEDNYTDSLGIPTLELTAENDEATGKPVIVWERDSKADHYKVYRSTSKNKNYKCIDTTEDAFYMDETASAGKTYYYKVQAICKIDEALDSDKSAYVSAKCLYPQPEITEVTTNSSGYPRIKWDKVKGAKKYQVYYSTEENGEYKKLTTTSSTSYTYSKAKRDTEYFFKVRAYGSSSSYAGEFSEVVSGYRALARPSISLSTSQSKRTVTIKWKSVSKAIGYQLQCSVNGGEFTTIAEGNILKFVHTDLAPGNEYTYRLRALSDREETYSRYSSTKSSTIKVGKPVVTITLAENGKPQLTWEAVEGAVEYQIYYATSKRGSYKRVETTEELTFIYEAAKKGKTCYFKVRAVDINGAKGDYSSYVKIKSK